MRDKVLLMSAPIHERQATSACTSWAGFRPFQSLLGQDAQMAGISKAASAIGLKVSVLTAPEIYSDRATLGQLEEHVGGSIIGHLRLGTARFPRVFKKHLNAVVLAEEDVGLLPLSRHPFASGSIVPPAVTAVLTYDATSYPVSSLSVRQPRIWPIMQEEPDKILWEQTVADLYESNVLQSSCDFNFESWQPWRATPIGPLSPLSAAPRILLPWNLAAPASHVPLILHRTSLMAAQGRFPLQLIVLPYNNVPGSSEKLNGTVIKCRSHLLDSVGQNAILWARSISESAAFALVKRCRRAWVDVCDPEWRWTASRLSRLGLNIDFISETENSSAVVSIPQVFKPNEPVSCVIDSLSGKLFHRSYVLSTRQIINLVDTIVRGHDDHDTKFPQLVSTATAEDLGLFLNSDWSS